MKYKTSGALMPLSFSSAGLALPLSTLSSLKGFENRRSTTSTAWALGARSWPDCGKMSRHSVAILLIGLLGIAVWLPRGLAAEVACYAPDGMTVAPNDSFVPCNKLGITQQGVFSSCCQLDGDLATRDLCASSGLCVRAGVVRREFCTDKTWQSSSCVRVCLEPQVSLVRSKPLLSSRRERYADADLLRFQWGGSLNDSVELTPCTDGTFCCGHNNLTCCGTPWAVSVPAQLTIASWANGTNATTNGTAIVQTSTGPGIYAVAGLAIGIGVIILVSLGIIFYLKRQTRQLKRDNKALSAAAAIITSKPPSFEAGGFLAPVSERPESLMPGRPESFSNFGTRLPGQTSSSPSAVAPSLGTGSHVPSMQEFAAFKALYGTILAQQHAAETQNRASMLGPEAGNPNANRPSELEATGTTGTEHLRHVGTGPIQASIEGAGEPRQDPAAYFSSNG